MAEDDEKYTEEFTRQFFDTDQYYLSDTEFLESKKPEKFRELFEKYMKCRKLGETTSNRGRVVNVEDVDDCFKVSGCEKGSNDNRCGGRGVETPSNRGYRPRQEWRERDDAGDLEIAKLESLSAIRKYYDARRKRREGKGESSNKVASIDDAIIVAQFAGLKIEKKSRELERRNHEGLSLLLDACAHVSNVDTPGIASTKGKAALVSTNDVHNRKIEKRYSPVSESCARISHLDTPSTSRKAELATNHIYYTHRRRVIEKGYIPFGEHCARVSHLDTPSTSRKSSMYNSRACRPREIEKGNLPVLGRYARASQLDIPSTSGTAESASTSTYHRQTKLHSHPNKSTSSSKRKAEIASTSANYHRSIKLKKEGCIPDSDRCAQFSHQDIPSSSSSKTKATVRPSTCKKKSIKVMAENKDDYVQYEGGIITELPEDFRQRIEALNGRDVRLIAQKTLQASDVSPDQGRLLLSTACLVNGLSESDFLAAAGTSVIIRVGLLEPSMLPNGQIGSIRLSKWGMGRNAYYTLLRPWRQVFEREQFQTYDVVQVWSFRYDEVGNPNRLGVAVFRIFRTTKKVQNDNGCGSGIKIEKDRSNGDGDGDGDGDGSGSGGGCTVFGC